MPRKRSGVPTDPVGDALARQNNIVVIPLNYIFPEGLWCHYCDQRPASTRDHIVPKALFGSDAWWNLVPSCVSCNSRKGDQMPTCECSYCRRAVQLFEDGHNRKRGRHPSLFSLKGRELPLERHPDRSV